MEKPIKKQSCNLLPFLMHQLIFSYSV